jgi:glycosyltransferase involved in cell wall biosynthesis
MLIPPKNPKLKIAILSYRSAPFGGGQGIYVKDISLALKNLGHSVDVISGEPYPILEDGVNLIKLPGMNLFETFIFKDRLKKFIKSPKTFVNIYEFLSTLAGGFPEMYSFGKRANEFLKDNNNYDVVIDNQSLSYGMLEIQKRFPFIEIIHHPITMDLKHDLEAGNKLLYKISRKRWYSFLRMQKRVAPKLRSIITPSMNSKSDIENDLSCSTENIIVINNGLDSNIFRPYESIIRNKLRLITTASADVPLKGLDYTLGAVAELRNELDIELIVIGNKKDDGHTSRLIKKLNLEKNIIFKTNLTQEDIAKEYAKSSIAIVSSLYEGFGYPVIEAMSCSIPLIAAKTSSIPELVGGFAHLIDPKDIKQLVKKVKEILKNYDENLILAKNGRAHIQKQFNWEKISKQYQDVIYENLNRRREC